VQRKTTIGYLSYSEGDFEVLCPLILLGATLLSVITWLDRLEISSNNFRVDEAHLCTCVPCIAYGETIFTKFSELVDVWVRMTNLIFVLRSLKGRCYGNQFISGLIDRYRIHSLRLRSTTIWNFATSMPALTAAMISLHGLEMW